MSSAHMKDSRCTYPRVLMIDVTPPGWTAVRTHLCEALANVLCLSAASAPSGEMLSIYTINERHQCLLPLLEMRGNLVPLQRCLAQLRSLPGDGISVMKTRTLSLALLDSLQQNKQLMQHNSTRGCLQSSFVEVSIVSTRSGREIAIELDQGLDKADLTTLRRLLVLHISHDREDDATPSPDPGTDPYESSHIYDIEFRVSLGDVLSLENFFKLWLLKRNGEREEVTLILPEEDSQLSVFCDVHQPLLNPGLLHGPGDHSMGPVLPRNAGGLQTEIRVIRALSSRGICGSVLYGLPSILTPTASWELEWDQLEANQDHFQALCHCLQSQEMSLLACTALRSSTRASSVVCHFIVSASDCAALLLRPAAVRELLLVTPLTPNHPLTEKALQRAEGALRCLDVESVYNPLQVTSNLYTHLQETPDAFSASRRHWSVLPAVKGRGQHVTHGSGKARAAIAPLPLVTPMVHKRGPGADDGPALKMRHLQQD